MRELEAAACDWQVVALNLRLTARGQARQVDAPVLGSYSNTLHAHGTSLPTGQLLPAGHSMPEEDCGGQYKPAGHALHRDEPGFGAKVFGAHGKHDVELLLSLKCPGGQDWQSAEDDDPLWLLCVPTLQSVHALQPLTFENVPAAQGSHAAGEDDPLEGLLVP